VGQSGVSHLDLLSVFIVAERPVRTRTAAGRRSGQAIYARRCSVAARF
jgi:hypothetical protein